MFRSINIYFYFFRSEAPPKTKKVAPSKRKQSAGQNSDQEDERLVLTLHDLCENLLYVVCQAVSNKTDLLICLGFLRSSNLIIKYQQIY